MDNVSIMVYTYKYLWEKVDGSLCIKYLTESEENHLKFQDLIKEDQDIIACYREYINEVDLAKLNFTESVKEKKEKGD